MHVGVISVGLRDVDRFTPARARISLSVGYVLGVRASVWIVVWLSVASACGDGGSSATSHGDGSEPTSAKTSSGADSTNATAADSAELELACSVAGGVRFPVGLLDGPEFTGAELAATEVGRVLGSFFVGGEGEVEGGSYLLADGFSVVSESLVIGYDSGLPASSFEVVDGRVRAWGSCAPNYVRGDLVAARWRPVGNRGRQTSYRCQEDRR